jgi:cell wall-associated NlpC family hydrolase
MGPVYGNAGLPMGDGSFAAMLAIAEAQLGKPYIWGASGPNAFDCSGFTSYVINQSGVGSVGRQTAQGLFTLCNPVSPGEAMPGDLVFFHSTYSTSNTITHVGIFTGHHNGRPRMIHAGSPVSYAYLDTPYWQRHFHSYGRLP